MIQTVRDWTLRGAGGSLQWVSAKVIAGLVLAFGCGVALGVGIAAIGRDTQETERLAAIDWVSAINPAENPVYAVPVRVRRHSGPPEINGAFAAAAANPEMSSREMRDTSATLGLDPAVAVSNPETSDLFAVPKQMGSDRDSAGGTVAQNGVAPRVSEDEVAEATSAEPIDPAGIAASASNDVLSSPHSHGDPVPEAVVIGQTYAQPEVVDRAVVDAQAAIEVAPSEPETAAEPNPETDHAPAAAAVPNGDREPGDLVIAALPPQTDPLWIRNAAKTNVPTGAPVIAIIIDDMGIDQKRSRVAIALSTPLTLSFIPYGYHLRELTTKARAAGHEIMLHLPMEPLDPEANPGPNALLTKLDGTEILRRLRWGLDRFEGYVGVNNHMGSKFSAWRPGMKLVMNELRSRGLLFLDSWTSSRSVGLSLSKELQVPNASRDIFIDHDISQVAIQHSLAELEYVARQRGFAVGIGHPHDLTLSMLKRWMAEARARGIEFVPISAIVRRGMKSG
ncbi:MAG: divergent polysaccharide deacetylase family protein [Alphaproteobacteria bacterium]|nr:divergent polysaccharide deacetylase family protein [Alphaproteobacteria bacterium]